MSKSLIGTTVGQYQVVAELGHGQHSVVYKAWQQSLERHVALKVLQHSDETMLHKFQAEARLTARLIEDWVPNIRRVYEVGQTADGSLFVALEYVEDSLHNLMRRFADQGHRINPAAAAGLLTPAGDALDALHKLGWVHLDIKPQNILISDAGRSVLADFGIAQRQGTETHACTPTYASPEQAAGDRPVGPWSDIYSLGVVFYEIVTERPPVRGDLDIVLLNQHLEFTPASPRKANPSLSAGQERAIMRALSKAPQERQPTAGELIQDLLQGGAAGRGFVDTPSMFASAASSWSGRLPRPVLVGGLLIVLLAMVVLVTLAIWPQGPFAAPGSVATASTILPTTTSVPTTPTKQPTAVRVPTSTRVPTATLAPTYTRVVRPTATPLVSPTP
ncbi:serine/threonine-protein kinase [Chloroflexota bacterium]